MSDLLSLNTSQVLVCSVSAQPVVVSNEGCVGLAPRSSGRVRTTTSQYHRASMSGVSVTSKVLEQRILYSDHPHGACTHQTSRLGYHKCLIAEVHI